ncbi:MAG: hypothetical protein BMS9Abin15_1017 [Gammaproteobacteria bacterium]|nr:MAG: hypothetical protein BMS9Abin15_1017 [Gammaproteobacteria bacterium]
MPAKITLKVTRGKLEGMAFAFNDRTTCIVGRAPDCNIKLPDDKAHNTISRYHCLIDINPPAIRIRDFGSRNGTYVNGKKIGQRNKGTSTKEAIKGNYPEYDLNSGDEIKLGETVFQVDIEAPGQEETQQATRRRTSEPSSMPHNISELSGGAQDFAWLSGIKGYSVIRELGKGGMGAVYLADDLNSGEQVALKVMLPQVAVSEEARQMFLRETKNTEALHHTHVVELKYSGCIDEIFYFTLEYCNRGSLSDLMKQEGGWLSVDTAIPIFIQALEGLEYAHNVVLPDVKQHGGPVSQGSGLVHRDLKPANIYLTDDAGALVAKVGDFGLAKAFDSAGLSGQTATGSVAGTPYYMPRQQILNFKYSKPEVDVWGMAATFYKAVTAFPPRCFPRGQDPWLVALKTAAVPICERNAKIPKRIAEVIDAALIDNPEITFKTAAQLKEALKGAL